MSLARASTKPAPSSTGRGARARKPPGAAEPVGTRVLGGFGAGPVMGLGPPVQMLCANCAQEAEEEEVQAPSDAGPVQAKCAACAAEEDDEDAPVQKACAACAREAEENGPVQRKARGAPHGPAVQHEAQQGLAGADQPLPHGARIQSAFGRYDVSDVRTRTGGAAGTASRNMGAEAFTSGRQIGFRATPSLRLAAHEATHVVQQSRGVQLKDKVGRPGDRYERHADAVADRVAVGKSAEGLLDAGPDRQGGAPGDAVQMQIQIDAAHDQEPALSIPTPPAGAPGGAAGEGGGAAAGEDAATGENEEGTDSSEAFADEPEGEGDAAGGGEGGAGGEGAGGGESGGGEAGQPAGAACAPACYEGPREEPDEEPDETPPNPAQGEVESNSSEGTEEELDEVDDCPADDAAAGAAGGSGAPAAPAGGAGGAGGGTAPAGEAGAGGPAAAGTGPEAGGGASAATEGGAPEGESGSGGAPESGGGDGDAAAGQGGDMAGSIAFAETGRDAGQQAFSTAQTALMGARDRLPAMRAPMAIAAPEGEQAQQAEQRRISERRADRFFATAADSLQSALTAAGTDVVAQLNSAQLSGKAQIDAAMAREKAAISGRIRAAERAATAEAAVTRAAVHAQTAAYVSVIETEISGSIEALNTAATDAQTSVDTLETTTLDEINTLYAEKRTEMENLGTTKGAACVTIAEGFATQYEGFRNCTEDGFWDGNLSERRANAQAEAARKVGDEYNTRMTEAAQKRAREVTQNGRRADRCGIIGAANRSRATLDTELPKLVTALNGLRDSALAQAAQTETRLMASVDNGLAGTMAALAQQEHDQRQAVNDAGYMQKVAQEQIALNSAAAILGNVARAAGTVDAALSQARATLSAQAVDPDMLDATLSQIESRVTGTVDGLRQSAYDGEFAAEGRLFDAALSAEASLAGITASNAEAAQVVTQGYLKSMRAISGTDNFATARTQMMSTIANSTAQSLGALGQIYTGFQETTVKTKADARTNLDTAITELGTNLDQSKAGLECEITSRADEAASKEPPAWKMIVAVLLVILVIIIVIAVTVLTAGAGGAVLAAALGGPLMAAIIVGAAVGAVVGGLMYMAQSLWTNQDITLGGLAKAVVLGAVFGAVGGAAGFFLGPAVGAVVGKILSSPVAAQLATALIVNGGIDVVSQLVMGGFSLDNFSWEGFGFSMFLTLVSFGAARYAAGRAPTTPIDAPDAPAQITVDAPDAAGGSATPRGPPNLRLIPGEGGGGRPSSGTGRPSASARGSGGRGGGPAFEGTGALKLDPMARGVPEGVPAPQRHLQPVPDAPDIAPAPAPRPTPSPAPRPAAPPPGLPGVPGSAAVAASAATLSQTGTGQDPSPQPQPGPDPQPVPQPQPDPDPETRPKEECENRPPVVLFLPAAKSVHLATYLSYIGQLQHRVGRNRSTSQLTRWRSLMRNWMTVRRPDLLTRATGLGLSMEDLIRPNWSRAQFFPSHFEVDHIIEMQVTPIGRESSFDLMFNYELLDQASNGSVGPELQHNIRKMREALAAACNDNRWMTEDITFETVAARGALFNAGRWSRFEIREGDQLDAYENLTGTTAP